MLEDLGYATEIHGFNSHMIRWCSLHTFNLGAMVWASAGALDTLVTKAWDSTCNLALHIHSKVPCGFMACTDRPASHDI